MKYIVKTEEPEEVTRWKNFANDNWQPRWDNFQNPEKRILKQKLVDEQGYICCYCQQRIFVNSKTEIEHINPREFCTEEEKLDYLNLIASCEGNQPPNRHDMIDETHRHCNNFRKSKNLPITPLMPNCESCFKYNFNGNIYSDDDDTDTETTINNLNLHLLNDHRKQYIEGWFFDEEYNFLAIDKDQYQIYFSSKSDIDSDGLMKFPEYSGVVLHLLNQLP